MRSMNGRKGKKKVPQHYQDKVRLASHMVFSEEYERDPVNNWPECVKAIERKLHDGNNNTSHRYSSGTGKLCVPENL